MLNIDCEIDWPERHLEISKACVCGIWKNLSGSLSFPLCCSTQHSVSQLLQSEQICVHTPLCHHVPALEPAKQDL